MLDDVNTEAVVGALRAREFGAAEVQVPNIQLQASQYT